MSGPNAGPAPRLPVIGLTGAPGSGKSEAARLLAERGGAVVDADRLAREAAGEPEVVEAAVRWWGEAVRNPAGGLDRAEVARRVFRDPEQRRRLEGLIHPRVAQRRAALHAEASRGGAARFVVEDCPLLLEAGLDAGCDEVWLVEAPREARLLRVAARGWDAAELDRREAAQASPERRRERADRRLDNGGTPEGLERAVAAALDAFLRAHPAADAAPRTG